MKPQLRGLPSKEMTQHLLSMSIHSDKMEKCMVSAPQLVILLLYQLLKFLKISRENGVHSSLIEVCLIISTDPNACKLSSRSSSKTTQPTPQLFQNHRKYSLATTSTQSMLLKIHHLRNRPSLCQVKFKHTSSMSQETPQLLPFTLVDQPTRASHSSILNFQNSLKVRFSSL
jgi:hypothetical protein